MICTLRKGETEGPAEDFGFWGGMAAKSGEGVEEECTGRRNGFTDSMEVAEEQEEKEDEEEEERNRSGREGFEDKSGMANEYCDEEEGGGCTMCEAGETGGRLEGEGKDRKGFGEVRDGRAEDDGVDGGAKAIVGEVIDHAVTAAGEGERRGSTS